MKSIYLGELTSDEAAVAFEAGAMVIVPIGATEQHGPHLPLETDWRLCNIVAERAASVLASEDVPVLLTPPVWCGYSPHHMEFAGTLTLEFETFRRIIADIARSLWKHGARKILLLNGHGGNSNVLRALVQQLRFEHGTRVAAVDYWDFALPFIAGWRDSDPGGIDHACEMETSLMLAAREDLVQPQRARDATWSPYSEFLSVDIFVGAPVTVAWTLAELSDDGVLGNAAVASQTKGEELLAEIVTRVASFLRDFARWDWEQPREI